MAYELLLESFDTGSTDKWVYNANPTYTVLGDPSGLRGTKSLKTTYAVINDLVSDSFTPSSHVVFGVAVKFIVGDFIDIRLRSGTTLVGGLRFNSAGVINYLVGSSLYTDSGITIPVDAWVNLEFGFHVSDTGSVSIRVNNDGAVFAKAMDTLVTAASTIDNIHIVGGSAQGTLYFDDLYIAYGDELKFLGRWQVDALALTGNATPQDFTPDTGNAWERLNAATGYVSSSTVNHKSLFESATITDTALTVHGVQVTAIANTVESGPRQMAAIVASNSVEETGTATDINIGDTPMRVTSLLNPDTGTAWTQSQIDAMQVGFKIVT